MYTNVSVNISDKQKEQHKKALAAGDHLSHLSHGDLVGNDIIGVTQSQLSRLKKAHETGRGVIIKMSKTQVARNMKIEGGFLSLLTGLASRAIPFIAKTVLPALGVGALPSLASTGVHKLVGDRLHIKKGGCMCEVETDGKRVLLEPADGKSLKKLGNGLYLRKEGKIYDRKGLLLGAQSPLKNIPILGMIL